jgi:hypothetical protein
MTEPNEEVEYEDTASIDQLTDEQLQALIEQGNKEDEEQAARTDEHGFLTDAGETP